jgi:hypothetical protein
MQRDSGERLQAALDVVEQRVVRAGHRGRGVGRFHPHILPVLRRTRAVSGCRLAVAQIRQNLLQRMLICAQYAAKNGFF